jgi:TonB family protein
MKNLCRWISCALVISLEWGPAAAQAQQPLALRMSLTYQGAAVASVFEALASVLGCRLQMDPRVAGSVTLEVRNVTAETVIRAVCESVGCRWRLDKGVLVVDFDAAASAKTQADLYARTRVSDVHEEIPAQIVWSDVPLEGAAKILARMLDADLSLDPSLSGKRASLDQNRGSAWAALGSLCQQAGCRWRMVEAPRRLLLLVPLWSSAPAGDFALGLARVGDPGVTAPRIVNRARARYSEAAMRAKVQGQVDVECVVQTDGTVGAVRVVKSLDKVHGLDAEAAMAAKLHVFEPGTKDGRPIAVVTRIEFTFTLR